MRPRVAAITVAGAFLMVVFGRFCFINEYGEYYLLYVDMIKVFLSCAVVLFVSMVATYICHILGHITAGTLTGYKLIAVEAYSLILRKTDGKFLFVRQKGKKGIYVRMSPPEYNNGKFPFVLYRYGAVIAFLAVAAVLAGLLIFYLYREVYFVSFYLFCSLMWFVMNMLIYMLPVKKGARSVSAEIKMMKRDENIRRAVWTLKKAYTDIHQGIRLRAQPDDRFYMPEKEYLSNDITSELVWLKLYRYLDMLDFENAEKMADILLSEECNQTEVVKNTVLLEKIFIELVTLHRSEVIGNMLTPQADIFMKRNSGLITVKRVRYALALLYYGDTEAIAVLGTELEKAMRETLNKADEQFTADLKKKAEEVAASL